MPGRSPALRSSAQQFSGKVEPGSRRGGGTWLPGVHRLIALGIGQRLVNVGRKWYTAQPLEGPGHITTLSLQSQETPSRGGPSQDLGSE